MAYKESKKKIFKEGDDFYKENNDYEDDYEDTYKEDHELDTEDEELTLAEKLRAKGYDKNSTEVIIPDGVTKIDDATFFEWENLKSVYIPDSVTEIGKQAFDLCRSLKSINIPNSVTKIGWGAFLDCESLESINIPDKVTEIGDSCFFNCENLKLISCSYNLDLHGALNNFKVKIYKRFPPYSAETMERLFNKIYRLGN